MKIGNIEVRFSILHLGVFVFFTGVLLFTFFDAGMDFSLFVWGIPTLLLILTIPLAMNYMSQSQYRNLRPVYEAEAKTVRTNQISETMIGKPVRLEGVIERAYFKFLNRPQYLLADRTGEISVKMFTTPEEDVEVGDVVVVLGSVIRRYMISGDPVVNGVSIRRKVKENPEETGKDVQEKKKRK